jgi:hypothetical protein
VQEACRPSVLSAQSKSAEVDFTDEVTGLAVWLGTSSQTLLDYQDRKEFLDTIVAAKDRLEAFGEACLFDKDYTIRTIRSVMFSLGNNRPDWKERGETDHNIKKDVVAELAAAMMGDQGE